MAVITISRGSYSMGREIAERVAKRLNYQCISHEILLEASDRFHIPEIKLEKNLWGIPSFIDKLTHEKTHYVFFVQSRLVKHVAEDNLVYHGFGGHLFLKKVPHILKVRITADIQRRIAVLAEREKINKAKALSIINKMDTQRRKWTKRLYGADPSDLMLYDLMIKIHKYDIDDAVDLICRSVSLDHFKITAESKKSMDDLALACKFKTALFESYPDILVVSEYGNILIYSNTSEYYVRKIKALADSSAGKIKGINSIEIHNNVSPPDNAV
jgi:cytidylate kinase